MIDQNIEQGRYLTARITETPELELMAPTSINIVCFRYQIAGADEATTKAINTEIMLRIQEAGTAMPSDTTVHNRYALRVAINNHRTTLADLDLFIEAVLHHGTALEQAMGSSA